MARTGISLEALHWYLWERRAKDGSVRIVQKDLAAALDVTRPRVSQAVAGMVAEGRLEKIVGTRSDYEVRDPAASGGNSR